MLDVCGPELLLDTRERGVTSALFMCTEAQFGCHFRHHFFELHGEASGFLPHARKGNTVDSLHEIPINAPALKVYDAWTTKTGLEQWWTSDVNATHRNGALYELGFDGGRVKFYFQPLEQVPGARVRWRGVDGPNMPGEWVDTEIDVRISTAADGRTRLQFAHRNWRSSEGFYSACNTSWGELMYRLRDVCESRSRGPLFK